MRNRFSSLLAYAEYQYEFTNKIIIPLLKHWKVSLKNKRLIDIGCGLGGASVAFAKQGCQCVGIDINEKFIEFAKKKFRKIVTFFIQDICDPSFSALNEYDIAIFRDVIEHVHDPEKAMLNIFKLLKEGGFAYISFPPFYSPFGGHQGIMFPYMHLLPDNLYFRLDSKKKNPRLSSRQDQVRSLLLGLKN